MYRVELTVHILYKQYWCLKYGCFTAKIDPALGRMENQIEWEQMGQKNNSIMSI